MPKRKLNIPIILRKKIKSPEKKRMKYHVFKPYYIPISNNNIDSFSRPVDYPKDCVINALLIIKLINNYHADIMRILIGDSGVSSDQMTAIFTWSHEHKYIFEFKYYDNINKIENILNHMPVGHCIFCGVLWIDGHYGHAIIVGKYLNGDIVVIDPQRNPIIQPDLLLYLQKSKAMFIMNYK
jgi:hypothetical protein